MPLYDTIGKGYAKSRLPDHRIVRGLCDALSLQPPATLLDIGAGTAKYARALADEGFNVLAVEPSAVMRAQAVVHPRVQMIAAAAEEIPLPAGAADGGIIVLALHHFLDRRKACGEILRVIGNGPLAILTFEPQALTQFWLTEYFPSFGREVPSSFSELAIVADEVQALTGREVRSTPFLLPRDLEDKIAAAGWGTPEHYLNPQIRNGISSFALMPAEEVAQGLQRLADDLTSGAWDQRHGWLRQEEKLDVGYRFIVAK